MRSIEEQIGCRCIHFNGVMEKVCKKGIAYADVRVGKPYLFPCLQTGGYCEHATFKTHEQVKAEIAEIEKLSFNVLTAYALINEHINKTNNPTGFLPCICGGKIHYGRSSINGHILAKCDICDISFRE